MSDAPPFDPEFIPAWSDGGTPTIQHGGRELATVAVFQTALAESGRSLPLAQYCEVVNHLAHGREFRVLHDIPAFVARYEATLAAEDPDAPWQEGVLRLRDFGRAQLELLQPPQQSAEGAIFFAEDTFLGQPYRITAPGPESAASQVTYEPLPVVPFPPASAVPPTSDIARPA